MSGERFVIAECNGALTPAVGGDRGHGLTVSVLDRAYCHGVVQAWHSEHAIPGEALTREQKFVRIRAEARELADHLNAGGE